jgi:hypothetical protein
MCVTNDNNLNIADSRVLELSRILVVAQVTPLVW